MTTINVQVCGPEGGRQRDIVTTILQLSSMLGFPVGSYKPLLHYTTLTVNHIDSYTLDACLYEAQNHMHLHIQVNLHLKVYLKLSLTYFILIAQLA